MAETNVLKALNPTRVVPPGHYGIATATPGIVATMRGDVALAMMVARRNREDGLRQAVSTAFGLALPDGPKAVQAGACAVLGLAPGRWLVAAFDRSSTALLDALQAHCGDHAAIADQSDAFVVVDLMGAHVMDLLTLGPFIDLDPSVFLTGDCASSLIAHTLVTLWRTDDRPAFRLLIPRSYASTVTRFLVAGGAKFGFRMIDAALS